MADQTAETAFKQAIAAEIQTMRTDFEQDRQRLADVRSRTDAEWKAQPWYERVWLTALDWLNLT